MLGHSVFAAAHKYETVCLVLLCNGLLTFFLLDNSLEKSAVLLNLRNRASSKWSSYDRFNKSTNIGHTHN